jgi:hypothetical protein
MEIAHAFARALKRVPTGVIDCEKKDEFFWIPHYNQSRVSGSSVFQSLFPGSLVKLARTLASLGAAVVIAIVVIPFFLSPELVVSRTVSIKSSPADAWDLVVNLERHPAWHPWDIADSFPRLVFGETRHGAEASYFWIGSRGNHGMLKFERVNLKERTIDGVLDMSSLGESRIAFRFVPGDNGVQVTETFRKHTGRNIFRRYLHPVYRSVAGRQLEGNLARLKQAAEGNPLAAPAKQRQP